MTTDLTRDRNANQKENIEDNVSLAKIQSQEQDKFKTENRGDYSFPPSLNSSRNSPPFFFANQI